MSSLPAAVNADALRQLTAMGFSEGQARVALLRANNDVNIAAELISNGQLPEEGDNEFDLLAAAPAEPAVHAPTVFHARKDHEGAHDEWQDVTEGTIGEMVDARISIFTEMGFTAKQAEDALKAKNNDVNEALSFLLQSQN